jgi:hypothetical protein
MSASAHTVVQQLQAAQAEMLSVIEDIGGVLTHFREGIADASTDQIGCAKLCASDALELLAQIETNISQIQAKVAICCMPEESA